MTGNNGGNFNKNCRVKEWSWFLRRDNNKRIPGLSINLSHLHVNYSLWIKRLLKVCVSFAREQIINVHLYECICVSRASELREWTRQCTCLESFLNGLCVWKTQSGGFDCLLLTFHRDANRYFRLSEKSKRARANAEMRRNDRANKWENEQICILCLLRKCIR